MSQESGKRLSTLGFEEVSHRLYKSKGTQRREEQVAMRECIKGSARKKEAQEGGERKKGRKRRGEHY
jgi:hypothetical protein